MVTMFDKALTTTERAVAHSNQDIIEYAEWREFGFVDITPACELGHGDRDSCWCEPVKFTRSSGLLVFVHRRVH
jgi:hypothetical protein